jgi:hypothetical protein
MINSNIGYIICESYGEPRDITHIKTINGKVVAEGILQTVNEKNRNGRYYPREELFPQITAPRTIELMRTGNLLAECGHPLSKDLQRQATIDETKSCARFLKLWTDGDDIKAQFVGTNNELGRTFDLDLKEGVLPAWSLRALGSIIQTNRGCEVKNPKVITWDHVIYPSHTNAYTLNLVSESTNVANNNKAIVEGNDISPEGEVIPITNESVLKFIQAESANIKFVRECFDFAYSGIKLNESGSKVLLTTNEGDTLVINLESYVSNELLGYKKFKL